MEVVGEIAKDINLTEAERRLSGQLPSDIQALLRVSGSKRVKTSSANKGEFSEESLAKARTYLNGIVEKSIADLDKVTIECKEFEERNRETFSQVSNDIKRISGQISDLRRKQIGANEDIRDLSRQRQEVLTDKQNSALQCERVRLEKHAELTLKEDDLAVFDFILEATKCTGEDAAAFLEVNGSAFPHICSTETGELVLHFDDHQKQARLDKIMTSRSRKALHDALAAATVWRGSFL